MFIFHLNIFFLFIINSSNGDLDECSIWSQNFLFNTSERNYYNNTFQVVNFDNFEDLNAATKVCLKGSLQVEFLNLFPENEALILNDNLRFDSFMKIFSFKIEPKIVVFHKIKGFSLSPINKHKETDYLTNFHSSFLNFYINQTTLLNEDLCQNLNINSSFNNYFGTLQHVYFSLNVIYSLTKVCPYVFMNSNLVKIVFKQISNSFIFRNQLRFIQNLTNKNELNVQYLREVDLEMVYEYLTNDLLDESVFRKISMIHLRGIVEGIHSELFVKFEPIRYVEINFDNLRQFLHRQESLKW